MKPSLKFAARIAPACVLRWCVVLAAAALFPPALWAQVAARPRIEKASDLPRFTYPLQGALDDVVRNSDRFAPLASALRRDMESVLAGYDIADVATRRSLLTQLALLDFLEGRYDAAGAGAEAVRALQAKPADKLLSGLRLRAMAAAAKPRPSAVTPTARRWLPPSRKRSSPCLLPWSPTTYAS